MCRSAIVIGGGMGGLAAALRLARRGWRVQVLEASDSEITQGKAGLAANIPARYEDFRVTAPDSTLQAIRERIQTRDRELARLSWDLTWAQMTALIKAALDRKPIAA